VGTGAEQMRNPTQRHTFNGDNLESFEVGPVILVGLCILQGRSPDLDLASDQARCTIPVGDFRQAGNATLALLPALATTSFAISGCATQQPRLVAEDPCARLGIGFEFDLARHTVEPDDPANQDQPVTRRDHAACAACFDAALYSALTF